MTAPRLKIYSNNTASALNGDELNTLMQTCDTVAQLRAFKGTTGQSVYVRGTYAAGDGGGGIFNWVYGVGVDDNGVTTIVPANQFPPAYWARQNAVLSLSQQVQTATAGQTLFTGLSYSEGFLLVFQNGILLGPSQYSATNGYSVTLANPALAGDAFEFVSSPSTQLLSFSQTVQIATAGQTVFTGLSYNYGFLIVFQNGIILPTAQYTATSGSSITLAHAASAGDIMAFVAFSTAQLVNNITALQGLSADPASPTLYQIYWSTTAGCPRIWNGTAWNNIRLS